MKIHDDLSIVLCGEAGQGIQTIEAALTSILKKAGYYIFATKEYMSRVRGGCNSTEIRVSSRNVTAYLDRIDILIPLSSQAISHLQKRISPDTLIVCNKEKASGFKVFDADFSGLAKEFGAVYESAAAIGFVLAILKVNSDYYVNYFNRRFAAKEKDVIEKNIAAAKKGYALGELFLTSGNIDLAIQKTEAVQNEILVNGAKAIALGAVAGGCNLISSYPMSPGTGVLNHLAEYSTIFDIVVEQAEDEIAAINMALGAWYAGARGMVTTSGGGFALMCEGLSLAGITETPVVICLGQRPGPATGLPTRTEQGDLNLALFAGHGEFPRIIFAPGTLTEAFYLTQKAFYFADKYQIPVILLADQYFMDSESLVEPFDPFIFKQDKNFIVETKQGYKRYQFTDDSISPRGIPGFGEGIVCVDSDEHTEEGYITEDFDLRIKMVNKRWQKIEPLFAEAIEPTFIGNGDAKNLVVCWGSNFHIVKEALEKINNSNMSLLHFSQIFPLPETWNSYFKNAEQIVVIENNMTKQFSELLQQKLNVKVNFNINKYNGLPFSVEEVTTLLLQKLK